MEALAAQKLIEQKLKKSTEELESWQKRFDAAQAASKEDLVKAAQVEINKLKKLQAELQTEFTAQADIAAQLKATIFRLENKVESPDYPEVGNLSGTRSTIDRMEGKILANEAYAELSSKDEEREAALAAEAGLIEDELAALKKKMEAKED